MLLGQYKTWSGHQSWGPEVPLVLLARCRGDRNKSGYMYMQISLYVRYTRIIHKHNMYIYTCLLYYVHIYIYIFTALRFVRQTGRGGSPSPARGQVSAEHLRGLRLRGPRAETSGPRANGPRQFGRVPRFPAVEVGGFFRGGGGGGRRWFFPTSRWVLGCFPERKVVVQSFVSFKRD